MSLDRIIASLKAVVREMLAPDASDESPAWANLVPWEYQVAEATETAFSGSATAKKGCPFPTLVNVPLMPGIAGTGIKPAVGSLVLVAFVNGDPARPRVVGWDQTVPESVALAMGTKGVVRVDDLGNGGLVSVAGGLAYSGADGLTAWAITAVAGATPVVFTLVPVTGVAGKIVTKATAGSTIVKAGG